MSADDVLDAIDHALEDWTVSGDAMRWTPEPPALVAHQPRTIVLHNAVNITPFADGMAVVTQMLAEWGIAVGRTFEGIEQWADAWSRDRRVLPLADEADVDLRARALELQRTRNTGPSRDLVHQRRPRRLS